MTNNIVAFDLETTGLNTQTDHIIQIGLVKFDFPPDGMTDQYGEFMSTVSNIGYSDIYMSYCKKKESHMKEIVEKSLENCKWETERFYTGRGNTIYKIFTDCKFPTEISYIKNNDGIIVKVNRYSNTKENTDISEELESDNRFDFEIDLDGNLLSTNTIDTIKSITLKIINE